MQRSRMPWMRAALAVIGAAITLAAASVASASHSGYWFFQGYLQRPDGTRTVHHEDPPGCCADSFVVRMSWEVNTHDMNFIAIHNDGSWHGFSHPWYDPDNEARFPSDTYKRGGCQNPSSYAFYRAIWTNCHIRNYP